MKIKIIIVDDNILFVEGIKLFLEKDNNFEVIATANNSNEFFQLNNIGLADIILLDIEIPGMNGFDIAKEINWSFPKLKLIAITMFQDKVYLEKLITVGFKGFVNKPEVIENLKQVIDDVLNGKFVFPSDLAFKRIVSNNLNFN